jgi:glycerol-3-phosphate acyltransferase PlsY
MSIDWRIVALVAASFLLGSIPFGVLFARRRGVDLKKVGSGNIGATNVSRALGKKVGILVLLLDAAKAFAPTAAALWLFGLGPTAAAAAGFAAFAGHIYSPWLKLKGGKGVASGLGAFLAMSPAAAGISAVVCVAVVAVTRLGSLGSLVGSAALLPALYALHQPRPYLIAAAVMFVLIVWRHRDNIRRMVQRRENRVFTAAPGADAPPRQPRN